APPASAGTASGGDPRHRETVLVRADGEHRHVLLQEAPLFDGAGAQIGWMASVLDVTEQRRGAEFLRQQNERMHRMSRLMTMGEMASALAHELNQPLSAVNSYIMAGLNTMESARGLARVGEAARYFEKAKAQTDRAGTIIRRVRQFVGQAGPIIGEVALDEVLAELLPLIRLQAGGADERVVLRLDAPRRRVLADRVLLEQVLLNLTKNAFEAMGAVPAARREVVIFTEDDAAAPDAIVLGVRDHGPGMAARDGPVLAPSFATTKPGGLGMGLAVCRTALELMGSRLLYGAAPGGGAEFRFTLRRAAAAATG
ncbi:MAG TPA: ATP-binding protein, partial [Burkholderiaceae bacterium]